MPSAGIRGGVACTHAMPPSADPFALSLKPLPPGAVNLPFLGSRITAHATFQYLLLGVSANEVSFAIPSWVVNREHFQPGDKVNFHLPFRGRDGVKFEGDVMKAEWDAGLDAQVCVAKLGGRSTLAYPAYASMETGEIVFDNGEGEPARPVELVPRLFRDLVLRKQGVRVYFKHIVPLFSRITHFPSEDYAELRRSLLVDIRARIEANITTLDGLRAQVEAEDFEFGALPGVVDLETLRTSVEAEINNELFLTTFDTPVIRPYLEAIRQLEDAVYLDYNTVVLLYASAV